MLTSSGGRMPLLDHLRELRKRIMRSALAILVAAVVGWYFYNDIIVELARPVCDLRSAQESGNEYCGSLYINGVLGPLNLQIKVAILAGIILSAPVWLFQLWSFIAPGLHGREKRNSIFFIIAATPFFASGAYLGYSILPAAVKVLFGFTPDALNNLVKFDDYLDFVLRIILLFGLAFELPVFLISLNLIGFLSGKAILKPWRVWVFSIVFFTAAFTPTADPLTMAFLAVPLILLYIGSGLFAVINDKRRSRKNSDHA
jgi:sec-independent protein translocase protein TatC